MLAFLGNRVRRIDAYRAASGAAAATAVVTAASAV